MTQQFKKRMTPMLLGIFLSVPVNVSIAAELILSDLPLSVVASVEPNVMFLLDTSGSMGNVTWYQGRGSSGDADYIPAFDPDVTYTDWCGGCTADNKWLPTFGVITLASINGGLPQGACGNLALDNVIITDLGNSYSVPRLRVEGELNLPPNTKKCLILPDVSGGGSTAYTGNYLNYLFEHFNNGDDLSEVIEFKTRMMVMKEVTTNLVSDTPNMRFGLTRFNATDGGKVLTGCEVTNSSTKLIEELASPNFRPDGKTPLAEAMYQVTRYFRGMSDGYDNKNKVLFTSPIQYSCQKNFVVAITDGLPSYDSTFSTSDPAIPKNGCPPSTCIQNWDGYTDNHPEYTISYPRFYDGPGGNAATEGGSLFFDDLAKFAYDIDMKTETGFDGIQNIETYAIGFSISNQMLIDAGHYGSGLSADVPQTTPPANYFTANDQTQLKDTLQKALLHIESTSASAASVAASTGYVSAGTSLYQGLYDTVTWTGNLKQFTLSIADNNTASIKPSGIEAASALSALLKDDPASRKIFSYDPDVLPATEKGIEFRWPSLSTQQKSQLNDREEILDYISGSQRCEVNSSDLLCTSPQVKNLRDRNESGSGFLGPIVNSNPIYIAKPVEYYPTIWRGLDPPENAEGAQKYSDFKSNHKKRKGVVYVGANDGMLHAFDGGYTDPLNIEANNIEATMVEKFAYIPNAVYPNLAEYADQTHEHRYYVDGTPTIIDAFFGGGGDSEWHTVLVGGLNKGGQGIYALDVTNPDSFNKSNVLWEFTDADDADLGYTYSRPAIIRMHNGEWAAIFGNGYNNTDPDTQTSTSGTAVLYIVNIRTGALIEKIDTFSGSVDNPNGLSTVSPVDVNGDYVVDYIYAGDLDGNLWRFDVTDEDSESWNVFGKGAEPTTSPIFVAEYTTGRAGSRKQPITAQVAVTRTNSGALMLYFGTGMYLQQSDIEDRDLQTFYGLLDNPEADKASNTPAVTRDKMLLQSITSEAAYSLGGEVRTFSSNAGNEFYTSWYVDLSVSGTREGERVIGLPIIRGLNRKKVIFTSIIPTPDVCSFGGKSWLIELDARNGNRTTNPVFDLNSDGKLDKNDNGGDNEVYNGWSQDGIQTAPAILNGRDNIEYKITSGSKGKLKALGEAVSSPPDGSRQSWRQLK